MHIDLQPGAEHTHLAAWIVGAEDVASGADGPGALQIGSRSSELGHC